MVQFKFASLAISLKRSGGSGSHAIDTVTGFGGGRRVRTKSSNCTPHRADSVWNGSKATMNSTCDQSLDRRLSSFWSSPLFPDREKRERTRGHQENTRGQRFLCSALQHICRFAPSGHALDPALDAGFPRERDHRPRPPLTRSPCSGYQRHRRMRPLEAGNQQRFVFLQGRRFPSPASKSGNLIRQRSFVGIPPFTLTSYSFPL
jgi:hypothetical protein